MDTRYAIQHRTTKVFLACTPSVGGFHKESAIEAEAASWATHTRASWELVTLEDFATAWDVVPVQVEMESARHSAPNLNTDEEPAA